MQFKNRFKELLEEENISPKRVADTLNIDCTSIYLYLQGSYPNIENAAKLANYFNCTLNFLFGLDDEPNNYLFTQSYDSSLFFERYLNLLNINATTHYRVSRDLGLGNSSFKKWQQGSAPKLETLIKLSEYFGYSIDYFIGRSNI